MEANQFLFLMEVKHIKMHTVIECITCHELVPYWGVVENPTFNFFTWKH